MSDHVTFRIIPIAAAVILDERRRMLLVRKRGTEAFMQPGGKIEAGEAPAAALERELQEELGVRPDGPSLFLGVVTAPAANEPDHLVEAALYRVPLPTGVAPGAEIEELVWVDPASDDLPLLAPLTRDHVLPLVRAGAWPPAGPQRGG